MECVGYWSKNRMLNDYQEDQKSLERSGLSGPRLIQFRNIFGIAVDVIMFPPFCSRSVPLIKLVIYGNSHLRDQTSRLNGDVIS